MRRYNIFIACFLVAAYGLAVFSFWDNRKLAADDDVIAKISESVTKIQNYASDNYQLPDSASDVKLSEGVSYEKYSEVIYLVCANFEQAYKPASIDSIDNYLGADKQQLIDEAITELKKKEPKTNYIASGDSVYVYYSDRQKGKNCFVMHNSASYDSYEDASFESCGEPANNYTIVASLVIEEVDTAAKTVKFKESPQSIIDAQGQQVTGTPVLSRSYDEQATTFCDSGGIKVDASYFYDGDPVSVYLVDIKDPSILRMEVR